MRLSTFGLKNLVLGTHNSLVNPVHQEKTEKTEKMVHPVHNQDLQDQAGLQAQVVEVDHQDPVDHQDRVDLQVQTHLKV
jgi:hypothetical protein